MGRVRGAQEKEAKLRNDEIDCELRKEKLRLRSKVKVLPLDTENSGKSTILKRMKLIHGAGYSEAERESFKPILDAMDRLRISLDRESNARHCDEIKRMSARIEAEVFPADAGEAVKALYFDAIDRITAEDYVPTDQDMMKTHVPTTAFTELVFHVADLTYRMVDVSGQRSSKRDKWHHCFDSVNAVMFVVAISDGDRLHEALTLFDYVCNSLWFVRPCIVIFFNKMDLFRKKLPTSPLKTRENLCSRNRQPPSNDTKPSVSPCCFACEYIVHRFLSRNRSEYKTMFHHMTCATDMERVKFDMAAVNDIIIRSTLCGYGLE
ncbi:guanine nucleotide binding protein, alpha subunit [Gonapodya prolifera JEL478]|uniref:Guanine nucleotide binding protein, alpha subunit n=1 Tax=Gonapodya prolifera (strain JEL478) TaxID=1344416 RepID=A0A139AA83_GONPJ|nr:guanine nucleotide binding protein, alpha subunit [Gonapodya prolifera JEL478]|eukprot:KXS13706.1 guanine nucleotide binding protein, alpha subunit [Gonapodya prolifera JEL478]